MEIRYKKLAEICDIQIGKTPFRKESKYWGKGNTWVTISDLKDKYIDKSKEEITDIAIEERGCKLIPKDTLLFSFKLSIGKMAFTLKPLYTNEAIAALLIKNKEEVDNQYLYFALDSIDKVGGNNAAMGKTLNKKSLSQLRIPLPSISDQRRIAALLTKAESLIQQREESLALAEEFLKFKFLEMFYFDKDQRFTLYQFNELKNGGNETFSNGPFGSNLLSSELTSEGVPVIYIRDIRGGGYNRISTVFVTPEKAKTLPSCEVLGDDVLIAKVGDPPGISAIYPNTEEPAIMTQDVIRIRPDLKKVLSVYLKFLLNSEIGQRLIKEITIKGTRSRFSLGNLKKIKLAIPSIPEQKKFAEIVQQVEKLKVEYQNSLDELGGLFASLSQKAFKGKLEFNPDFQIADKIANEEITPGGKEEKELIEAIPKEKPERTEVLVIDTKDYNPVYDDVLQFINRQFQSKFFTFEDLKKATKEEGWEYDFETLKNFVFQLIREQKLKQFFTDAAFKAQFEKTDPDYEAVQNIKDERIYFKRLNTQS